MNIDKFPNLFIVGAAKTGTTSLYNYLIQHPDIFGCENDKSNFLCQDKLNISLKEPRFLTCDLVNYNAVKDLNTYLSLYSHLKKNIV